VNPTVGVATAMESQPIEITQFLFSQALSRIDCFVPSGEADGEIKGFTNCFQGEEKTSRRSEGAMG